MERGTRPVTAAELVRLAALLAVTPDLLLTPREGGRPVLPKMRLRGVTIHADDEPQLAWFSAVQSALGSDPHWMPLSIPPRVSRLPPVQAGELAARWFRGATGLSAEDPVIPLSGFVQEAGVGVVLARLPVSSSISGCIVVTDSASSAVLVNSNHPPVRQRFTLAHELAHFLLDREGGGYACAAAELPRPGPRQRIELRADVFAAAFLLPQRAVRECLGHRALNLDRIHELGSRFGVSHAATISRLRALRLLGAAEARVLRRIGPPKRDDNMAAGAPVFRAVTESVARRLAAKAPQLMSDCRVLPDAGAVP